MAIDWLDQYLEAWDAGLFNDRNEIEQLLAKMDETLKDLDEIIDSPLPADLDELREKGIEMMWKGIDWSAFKMQTAYIPALEKEDRTRAIRVKDVVRLMMEAEEDLIHDAASKSPMTLFIQPWLGIWEFLKWAWRKKKTLLRLGFRAIWQVEAERNALFGVIAGLMVLMSSGITIDTFTKVIQETLKKRSMVEIDFRLKTLPQRDKSRVIRNKRSRYREVVEPEE